MRVLEHAVQGIRINVQGPDEAEKDWQAVDVKGAVVFRGRERAVKDFAGLLDPSHGRRTYALSIRQPWAWLILHAGKNIENRNWPTAFRGRVLIHAGKEMTRADYQAAAIFCSALPHEVKFPSYEEAKALCGGIVGEVEITGCVRASDSPWFCGEYGFVLRDARPRELVPCKGALGFFTPKFAELAA